MKFFLETLIFLLLCSASAEAQSNTLASGREVLGAAEGAYISGNYKKAQTLASQAQKLVSGSSVFEARLFFLEARLAAVFGDDAKIQPLLEKAIKADPTIEPEPYMDPPTIHHKFRLAEEAVSGSKTKAKYYFDPGVRGNTKLLVSHMPFGLGHFDRGEYTRGFAFLFGEASLFYLGITSTSITEKTPFNSFNMFMGIIGAWGYELITASTANYPTHPFVAEKVRFSLSFFPFGAAQAKNGHFYKSISIGALHAITIAMAGSYNPTNQTIGVWGFALSYAYSIYDGLMNHMVHEAPATTTISLSPLFQRTKGRNEFGLALNLDF